MKKTYLVVAVVVIVLGGAFAVRENRELARTKRELAALALHRTDLQSRTHDLEQRLRHANAGLAERMRTSAAAAASRSMTESASEVSAGPGPSTKPSATLRKPTAHTIIANDRNMLAAYLADFRGSLDFSYGGIFHELGFSPQQIERFKDVEVGLEERRMDLEAAAEAQGLDPKSAEYQKMWQDYANTRTLRKKEVLGEFADAYFALYRSQTVRELAMRALVPPVPQVGDPVTAAQVEKTAKILAANSRYSGSWVQDNTINWDVASVQLRDVLSPEQIETLSRAIQAQKVASELQARTRRLTTQFNAQFGSK